MQGRTLKAEFVCLVGIIVWVAIGFGIHFGTREDKQAANKASLLTACLCREK
jgi:ammonia channel protein AmtB